MNIGDKKNLLTLKEITSERLDQKIVGIFECDCGKVHKTTISRVKRNIIRSCGCLTGKTRLGKDYNWKVGQEFGKFKLMEISNNKDINGNIIGKFMCMECKKNRVTRISYIANNFNDIKCCKDDLIGERVDKLEVIQFVDGKYLCKCECGNTRKVSKRYLRQYIKVKKSCKNCISNQIIDRKGRTIGELSGTYWLSIIKGAIQRGISIEIDQSYAWELFLKQNKKCALSGVDLKLARRSRQKEQTASLDRIDSDKGYTKTNVQWIHKDINIIKNTYNNEQFIDICNKVSNYRKSLAST